MADTVPERPKDEYIEVRIPKLSGGKVPLSLTLLLMIVSFGAGLFSFRFVSQVTAGKQITDATGAYIAYAKELELDEKQFTECLTSGKYESTVTSDVENGNSFEVGATPTFFVNGRMLVGAQPYELFEEMIKQEISGERSPLTPEEASGPAQMNVSKGNLPVLGSSDAKITIIEFSDFQCPFCESFFMSTYPELKKNYIDTGKVQFAFRHYPLTSIHPNAQKAHEAAECANEQGKFWEYHDKLFQTQAVWTDLPILNPTES